MRRLFVLGVLLLLMRGLALLQEDGDIAGSGDPLTLAAIGFVLLASFTVAELGAAARLPKVTGYILAGILLGPFVANILSSTVVVDMKMFNTLALGLIATSAGLELDARGIARMWKTLSVTTALKVLLLPLFVGGTFYGLQTAFHFLPIESEATVIALAIVFSTLAIGTSPAISLAVLSETKAKGRLSDLVLGIAVLKDVVVVVCLAIAVAIARSLGLPEGGLDPEMLVHVGQELGASALAGVILAGLLILYVRFVGAEMLLFVAAMILVVAELAQALHLELLLVFIVAGFIVRNFTHHEHELMTPLQVVSLPVFVVFFTNAGAGVNLDVTRTILPFALALCGVRALAYYIASRVGSSVGGDPPAVRRVAWMAYLPQAGVTLGLVGMAATQLPELKDLILNTGMAVVAINLLVGPITLRMSLRIAGEIPEQGAQSEPADGSASATMQRAEVVTEAPSAPPPVRQKLEAPALEEHVVALEAQIRGRVADLVDHELRPWAETYHERLARFFARADGREEAIGEMLRWAGDPAAADVEARVAALRQLFVDLRAICVELPSELAIPLERRFTHALPEDSVFPRIRKFAVRVGAAIFMPGKTRVRVVPLRMATRVTIEPRVAYALREALGQWCRTQAHVLALLRQVGQGVSSVDEAHAEADKILGGWLERFDDDAERTLAFGLADLAQTLAYAGSREVPARRIRYSKVEPTITRIVGEIEQQGKEWGQRIAAAQASLRLALLLERLELHVSRVVESGFLVPLGSLLDRVTPEVVRVREALGDAEGRVQADEGGRHLGEIASLCQIAFPQDAHQRIRVLRAEFKQDVSAHDLAIEIRNLVATLPESIEVLDVDARLHMVRRPGDVALHTVPMRRICEQALIQDLLPGVDERLREANALINAVTSQIREHVGVATYAIDVVQRGHVRDPGDAKALILDGFSRARRRLDELLSTLDRVRAETLAEVREARVRAFESIRADATRRRQGRGPARVGLGVRVRRRAESLGRRIADAGGAAGVRLRRLYARFRAGELNPEIQQRYTRARLDARDLRDLLHLDAEPAAKATLPPIYGRLYSLESLHERRFFTARRSEMRALMKAEQSWLEGQGTTGALLVGRAGSGRTSLLNIAQLELSAKRVIRLGDDDDRSLGLLAAIADELRCAPDLVELRVALRATRTAIVIDDIESWIRPDPPGIREFARFLDVMIATRGEAFWIAAIDEDSLGLVDPILALRQAFQRVIHLGPVDAETLGRVMEIRNRVSGLAINYPARRMGRLLRRRADAPRRLYYRGLARRSQGNLRGALRAWFHDATVSGDTVTPAPRASVAEAVRFLDQIHPHALAIVVQAARFRDLAVEPLAATLRLPEAEVARHLAFLESAGFIEDQPNSYGVKRIPPDVQPTVVDALRRAGALQREVGT
ncbi:MAG: cation:proton antiporter [Nannocystaceae bacterium]